jgi:hypothetical protein
MSNIVQSICGLAVVSGVIHFERVSLGVICSGAATLQNGSTVTIGQPIAGRFLALDGSISVSAGFVPTLAPLPPTPDIRSITIINGRFSFSYQTQTGLTYVIFASTNLSTWFPISTNLGSLNGLAFEDSNFLFFPQRFYQVQQQ